MYKTVTGQIQQLFPFDIIDLTHLPRSLLYVQMFKVLNFEDTRMQLRILINR